jgi:hypothetical protein
VPFHERRPTGLHYFPEIGEAIAAASGKKQKDHNADNAALLLPPPVITVNKSVRDGLRYTEQEEIAMALSDDFLPIPKPIW